MWTVILMISFVSVVYLYFFRNVRQKDLYKSYKGPVPTLTQDPQPYPQIGCGIDIDVPKGPWINDHQRYPFICYRFLCKGFECEVTKTEFLNWGGYVRFPRSLTKEEKKKLVVRRRISGGSQGWIGFDCSQGNDILPLGFDGAGKGKYWTFEEVVNETRKLARQIPQM